MECFTILCFGLIGATVDRARVGRLRRGRLAGLLALGEDLLDVGIGFVHAVSIGGRGGVCVTPCATRSGVHPHRCLQVVVGVQVVVCVSRLASDATINGEAEHGGSDGAPLCLSHGDGAEVKGEHVGAGHGVVCG